MSGQRAATPDGVLAFFIPRLTYGGVERAIIDLARGFKSQQYPVQVVVCSEGGELAPEATDLRPTVLGTRRIATGIPRLARYLRRTRPRVLVSAKTHANVAAIIANSLSRTATAHVAAERSYHQFDTVGSPTDQLVLQLARRLYRRCSKVTAVSETVRQATCALTGIPESDVEVIHNGVVTPQLRELARAKVDHPWLAQPPSVILAVGRLVPEKGFDTLLRGFAIVRTHVEAKLLIIGEGSERQRLEALSARLGIASDVEMMGYVANPLPYMRESDLFVLSSRSEGFPNVLIEALYCGANLVATRCSSAVEHVLESGAVYGRIIASQNPEQMAAAILQALGERVDKRRLRRRAEAYSIEATVYSYEHLLQSIGALGQA